MSKAGLKSLTSGLRRAVGIAKDTPVKFAEPTGASKRALEQIFKDDRLELLQKVPSHTVKKAWYTLSHLLLDPGAKVIDAGSNDGSMAYAMAALKPDIHVTGIDINANRIHQAREDFDRPNLDYRMADLFQNFAEAGSADAIINSFLLHEIYSESHYNDRLIPKLLERQYAALKDNGIILIRDYVLPSTSDYVLMEIKERAMPSEEIAKMPMGDLLAWYSENARSHQETGADGFYLEELPPNYPNTRLFRLPIKWAYEFLLRKDDRANLQDNLAKEYAFYTESDYRKEFRALGARVLYTAPHWDDGFLKTRYEGKIRMYREDGTPIGPPPTSFIIVAQKVADNQSQILQERRTSRGKSGKVYLRTVRDERTGEITDIATRDMEIAEVLPYRVAEDGRLKVYLHEALPRGLVNSVPRLGKNLDGRKWSGHMTEAISLPSIEVADVVDGSQDALKKFGLGKIGVAPSLDASLQKGPGFYPDPYRIDERIETYYFRTENYHAPYAPKTMLYDLEGFSSHGQIRELDAQDVMNALAVGYLPSSRLEPQLLALYQMLGMKTEVWEELPIRLSEIPAEDVQNIDDLVRGLTLNDRRFKEIKGSAGNIRLVQSVFVDEGRNTGGGTANLAARDMEFIYQEDNTINTAVVLPLNTTMGGEVVASIITEYLPVPQRYKGTGLTASLPSVTFPKEVTDIDAAKRYIAEKFKVDAKFVARMGESFYTHIGMTPHRIYPFVITTPRFAFKGRGHGTTMVTPLYNLWKLLYWDNSDSFMRVVSSAYKNFCHDSSLSTRWDFDTKLAQVDPMGRLAQTTSMTGTEYQTPSSSPARSSNISLPFDGSISNDDAGKNAGSGTGSGDKGKMSGTSGFAGPNDDVMGGDFKATNRREPVMGAMPPPKPRGTG